MARVLLTSGRDLHLGGDVEAHVVAVLELTKPRITQLVLLNAAAGFYLGSPGGGERRVVGRAVIAGAAAGALGTAGGWTAAGAGVGLAVAALLGILSLWQLPHFVARAWVYREAYRRGGLAMVSVAAPDGRPTGRMVLLSALAVLPVSLL